MGQNIPSATVSSLQSALARMLGGSRMTAPIVATTSGRYGADLASANLQVPDWVEKTQAFFEPSSKTIVLFADKIPAGQESAVIAHELVHKNARELLDPALWNSVLTALKGWRDSPQSSLEHQIYARARVRARYGTRANPALYDEELFAYAVEEAFKNAVDSDASVPIDTAAGWLARAERLLERLLAQQARQADAGGGPQTQDGQVMESLKLAPEDLIALAYALAQIELRTNDGQVLFDRAQYQAARVGFENAGNPRKPAPKPLERPEHALTDVLGSAGDANPLTKLYSALARGLASIHIHSTTPEGWLNGLKGLTNNGKVKQEEVEWTGIADWLALQEGKVTKAEVLGYLQGHGVVVNEVTIDASSEANTLDVRVTDDNLFEVVTGDGVRVRGPFASQDQADVELAQLKKSTSPQYGTYVLPGGENYREVLLTLGSTGRPSAAGAARDYRNHHWEQKNVLAHVRLNDRTEIDGRKVLFIEEIQSDWGQDAMKHGFAVRTPDMIDKELTATTRERSALLEAAAALSDGQMAEFKRMNAKIRALSEKATALDQELSNAFVSKAVPKAPFVSKTDGWLNLVLKRVVTLAVEGGYDAVAVINGTQSARRYGMLKPVDSITYRPAMKTALDPGEMRVTVEGRVNDEETFIVSKIKSPSELPDFLGKDVAARLLAQPEVNGVKTLSGEGIEFGGRGMRGFYDDIVPSSINRLLRKLGGDRLEPVQLGQPLRFQVALDVAGKPYVRDSGKHMVSSHSDMESALREAHRLNGHDWVKTNLPNQPGFRVTERMRQVVRETGLPLFSQVAFHGSPHQGIQRFSTDKIGTGEGAQSYGWGLYFASLKTVAEHYQKKMASDGFLDGAGRVVIPERVLGHVNLKVVLRRDGLDAALALASVIAASDSPVAHIARADREVLTALRDSGGLRPNTGALYEVEIPDDDAFLLWDKPLESQPAPVLRALQEVLPGYFEGLLPSALTGKHLYERLSNTDATDTSGQENASKFLLAAGIKGIKYLDGLSRSVGEGTFNYVVFDGADTEIVRDDGRVENTEAFRAWFGDSKVVDKNGQPLVMYHGTTSRFSTFQDNGLGHFFTSSKDVALQYGDNVISVYLSLHNPLVVNARGANRDSISFTPRLARLAKEAGFNFNGYDDGTIDTDTLANLARSSGFDGLMVRNVEDGSGMGGNAEPAMIAVAFRPEQIKSAIGNNGDFDPANPDIRHSNRRSTDTPEFKRWFGDSKVVDAAGQPLLMYHGAKTDIDGGVFRMEMGGLGAGAYFTRYPGEAETYTNNAVWKTAANIVPAYISLQNPYITRDKWDKGALKAKENGHDGVVVLSASGEIEWAVPFDSRQIKSAIGNNGEFDPTNPDIRRSEVASTGMSNFQRWFGGSKVVDKSGAPMVVYRGEHGTDDGRLQTRLGSLTFTDEPQVASEYATETNCIDDRPQAPRVIPVYLSIQNPVIDNRGEPFVDFSDLVDRLGVEVAEKFARKHSNAVEYTSIWFENFAHRYRSVDELLDAEPEQLSKLYMMAFPLLDDPEFVQAAKAAGFDGAIHMGYGTSGDSNEFRVFDLGRIKSAIGNDGNYDPANPDIRHSLVPVTSQDDLWMVGSQVVNSDGKPLKVYHGTNAEFHSFDAEKSKHGFWFSESESDAADYGAKLIEAHLSLKNPALFERTAGDAGVNEAIAKAKAEGRDGLIVTAPEEGDANGLHWPTNYVAFRPDQIRRVSDAPQAPTNRARSLPSPSVRTVYHGSKTLQSVADFIPGLSEAHGDAYGVGAYLTTSSSEAAIYAGQDGQVFTIEINARILDLDAPLSPELKAAMGRLAAEVLLPSDKARFSFGRAERTITGVEDARAFFDAQMANWLAFGDRMERCRPEVVRAADGVFTIAYADFDAPLKIDTPQDLWQLLKVTGFEVVRDHGYDGVTMARGEDAPDHQWVILYNTVGTMRQVDAVPVNAARPAEEGDEAEPLRMRA